MYFKIVFPDGDSIDFETSHTVKIARIGRGTELKTVAFKLFMPDDLKQCNCSVSFDKQYDFMDSVELLYNLKNNLYVPILPNGYVSRKNYYRE